MRIISVDKNGIGVKLLGFHATVGIEPIIAADGFGGSLFAEAGTPLGQCAEAGVRGKLGIMSTTGSAYAQATAGQGLAAAAAGVEGAVGPTIGATGGMYAESFSGENSGGILVANTENDDGVLATLHQWMLEQSNNEEEDNNEESGDQDNSGILASITNITSSILFDESEEDEDPSTNTTRLEKIRQWIQKQQNKFVESNENQNNTNVEQVVYHQLNETGNDNNKTEIHEESHINRNDTVRDNDVTEKTSILRKWINQKSNDDSRSRYPEENENTHGNSTNVKKTKLKGLSSFLKWMKQENDEDVEEDGDEDEEDDEEKEKNEKEEEDEEYQEDEEEYEENEGNTSDEDEDEDEDEEGLMMLSKWIQKQSGNTSKNKSKKKHEDKIKKGTSSTKGHVRKGTEKESKNKSKKFSTKST